MEQGVKAGDVDVMPGAIGQFDITINGGLAFSKAKTGCFPTDEDIDAGG